MPRDLSSGGSGTESSVVLSLRELAEMEERRVEAAAQRAVLEQARRALQEREAQEALAEHVARSRVERDERDRREAAQAAALKHAAGERARTEVLVRAEAEQREHDARRDVEARHRSRRALSQGLLAGALTATLIAGVAYAGAVVPAERSAMTRATTAATSCDESLRDLQARSARTEERLRVAGGDLETAGRERDRLRSELESMTREVGRKSPSKPPLSGSGPAPRRPIEYFSKCPAGSRDPMCVQ